MIDSLNFLKRLPNIRYYFHFWANGLLWKNKLMQVIFHQSEAQFYQLYVPKYNVLIRVSNVVVHHEKTPYTMKVYICKWINCAPIFFQWSKIWQSVMLLIFFTIPLFLEIASYHEFFIFWHCLRSCVSGLPTNINLSHTQWVGRRAGWVFPFAGTGDLWPSIREMILLAGWEVLCCLE